MRATIHTLAQLALVALPVLVGYLCGRHVRQRHLDQAELDAWNDGFQAAVNEFFPTDPDRVGTQLDAAVEQAPHPSDQPWLN